MRSHFFRSLTFLAALMAGGRFSLPNKIFAHCDGMDGPVIKAAQKALEAICGAEKRPAQHMEKKS